MSIHINSYRQSRPYAVISSNLCHCTIIHLSIFLISRTKCVSYLPLWMHARCNLILWVVNNFYYLFLMFINNLYYYCCLNRLLIMSWHVPTWIWWLHTLPSWFYCHGLKTARLFWVYLMLPMRWYITRGTLVYLYSLLHTTSMLRIIYHLYRQWFELSTPWPNDCWLWTACASAGWWICATYKAFSWSTAFSLACVCSAKLDCRQVEVTFVLILILYFIWLYGVLERLIKNTITIIVN